MEMTYLEAVEMFGADALDAFAGDDLTEYADDLGALAIDCEECDFLD